MATATPCVVLSVIDNGPGMDEATRARIWEPGFSTKAAAGLGGRGYGLPSVRAFVEAAGGRVEVDSQPGEGTCVALWLPAGIN